MSNGPPLAPKANIILFEANSSSDDLYTAVQTAAAYPGVSVVSMSWGGDEFYGENSYDSYFSTPRGHTPVTFLASTGDTVRRAGSRPFAQRGCRRRHHFDINPSTYAWVSETGWSGSGGGQSDYEAEPSYQLGVQTSEHAANSRIAFDADPASGVAVYDSYDFGSSTPWTQIGGTSVSSPCCAGLMAIVDQLRASQGLGSLDRAITDPSNALLNRRGRFPRRYQRQQRRSLGRARLRHGHRAGHPVGQQARARSRAVSRRHRH